MRAPGCRPRPVLACALSALLASHVYAASPTGIYTCVDDKGRKLTSDRPIAECTAREQRILNKDGSTRAVKPPTLTAEEKAERDASDRKAAAERAALQDAARRDKNLMLRYRDEPSHQKAREAALDTVRLAVTATEKRLKDLQLERKPLMDEAEFYKGKPMPGKLKAQIEANDVAVEAQRQAAATQQAEIERVNRNFDIELARLRRLWAGAVPGSMGPLSPPGAAAPAASPKAATGG